jgi:hypothetical protein
VPGDRDVAREGKGREGKGRGSSYQNISARVDICEDAQRGLCHDGARVGDDQEGHKLCDLLLTFR